MITLQLTDDQANLMAHILQEMPYKHAAPLMDALRAAHARSQQPAHPAGYNAGIQQVATPSPDAAESLAGLTSPPKPNPPPRGMRVAKS